MVRKKTSSESESGKSTQPAHFELEALDPETGGIRKLRLMNDDLQAILKSAPRHKFYELRGDRTPTKAGSCVHETLLHPCAIFEGVRDQQSGGLCYCGHPPWRWTDGGSQVPPPPGMLFCVYISPRDSVYEWRWEF
jgi:hypothetical protein